MTDIEAAASAANEAYEAANEAYEAAEAAYASALDTAFAAYVAAAKESTPLD